jgi:Flp pilus assembly pilin Flp
MSLRNELWDGSTICSCLNSLVGLHKDEAGQGLLEYVVIMALVALGAVASMQVLANAVNSAFAKIGSILSNALS